jgi:hypothetical protein
MPAPPKRRPFAAPALATNTASKNAPSADATFATNARSNNLRLERGVHHQLATKQPPPRTRRSPPARDQTTSASNAAFTTSARPNNLRLERCVHHQRSVVEVGYLLPAASRYMDVFSKAAHIMDVRPRSAMRDGRARCRQEVPHLGGAVSVPPLRRRRRITPVRLSQRLFFCGT